MCQLCPTHHEINLKPTGWPGCLPLSLGSFGEQGLNSGEVDLLFLKPPVIVTFLGV